MGKLVENFKMYLHMIAYRLSGQEARDIQEILNRQERERFFEEPKTITVDDVLERPGIEHDSEQPHIEAVTGKEPTTLKDLHGTDDLPINAPIEGLKLNRDGSLSKEQPASATPPISR